MFERTRQGAVEVIRGDQPLSLDYVPKVAELIAGCEQHGQPRVVFDLTDVQLIDSSGLELLLDAQESFTRCGGQMKLVAPKGLCREILGVTGVGRRFEVFGDTSSAVGSFVK
jgi:anti-anti-sigma factor